MKKVIGLIIILACGAGIFFKLKKNKEEAANKVQKSEVFTLPAVTVASISRDVLKSDVAAIGTVTPYKEVQLLSETAGRVLSINFDNGSHVSAGQTLAKVDDELRRTAVSMAEVNLEKAKKDQTRIDTLFQAAAVAQSQTEMVEVGVKGAETQLKVAQRQLKDTRITSPISGVISMKFIEKGSTLGPGAPIATITDISRLKVRVSIPEADAFRIRKGDRVMVTSDVYQDVKFYGTIKLIAPKGDEAHNFPVEIELNNSGSKQLKAGMFAKVSFTSVKAQNSLTVPREAVIGSVKMPQVFVVKDDIAKLRSITLNEGNGTMLPIKEGLAEGDIVVISGHNNLVDGAKVTVVKDK